MADKKLEGKGANQRHVVTVAHPSNQNPYMASARELTRPEVQAAVVIQQFQGDNHDVNCLIRELEAQTVRIQAGDLGRAEAMLFAQAQTLDEVFNSLMRRAHANMAKGYGDACERYMRLALKAQSQCRTTLETLAEVKNPRPVAFVRQANIAHGPQQVNNALGARDSRGKIENPSNELSPRTHELLPDSGASSASSLADTNVEALGEIHRSENTRRQSEERQK